MKKSRNELLEGIFSKLLGLKISGKEPSKRVQKMLDKDPTLRKMEKDIDKSIAKWIKKRGKNWEPTFVEFKE